MRTQEEVKELFDLFWGADTTESTLMVESSVSSVAACLAWVLQHEPRMLQGSLNPFSQLIDSVRAFGRLPNEDTLMN